jgi:hypothetical protein
MLSLLHNLGLENEVSQQFVSGILCEFVNVYVEIVSGIVTPVASVNNLSAIALESGNGIK